MTKITPKILTSLFPFNRINKGAIERILNDTPFTVTDFQKGDIIFDKECYEKKIGFVLEGECEVEKVTNSTRILPINVIKKSGSFGILSVFSPNSEFPTKIVAKCKAKILFIDAGDMISIIKRYPTVSYNVIRFLCGRIEFLNKKLSTFSSASHESRVAAYLLAKYKQSGDEIIANMSSISRELNIGRASLYRILSSFESSGYIKTETKKIIFIDPKGLERII